MAATRINPLFSNKHAWICDLLISIIGFMVAFGFTAWLGYGMIKEVVASVSLKAVAAKIKR